MTRFGLAAAVLALGLATPAADASAADRTKTEVTLENASSNSGKTTFEGLVSSPKKSCAKDRKVLIYADGPGGGDEMVAKGRASDRAKFPHTFFYGAVQKDPPMAGNYYARVEATDNCKARKSEDYLYARHAPAAKKGGKAKTRVAFVDIVPVNMEYWYEGTIDAKRKCADKRKVTVYRVQSGKDEKIGTDKSNGSTGTWNVMDSDQAEGTYYAKTPATDRCKGDKSDKLSVL